MAAQESAPAAGALRLAVAAVGAVNIGVAIDAVLQAIPAKGALSALPRRQGALCGVAEHAGRLVPVVDLARWVELGAPPADVEIAERVMMLSDGRRTIGLKVDSIRGLTDVAPQAMSQVHHDDDGEEVFHTVVKSADMGLVLSILDVGRLIALASAWHESDGDAGAPPSAPEAQAEHEKVLSALLAVGDVRVALPAAELAEVIPLPELLAVGTAGSNRYCKWRDRTIPVVDAGALLGQPDDGRGRLLAIVRRDGLTLGLLVREAIELRPLAVAGAVAPDGGIAATIFEEGSGEVRVIDTALLFARTPEASISRSGAPTQDKREAQRANTSAYIVFQTDQSCAASIDAMEEILPLRAEHMDGLERLAANIEWRGQAVRLVDLRTGPEPSSAKPSARIIVVKGANGYAGCVVRHVLLLIPPHTGWLYRMALAGAGPVEFITTGEGSEQVSYRTVDLANR
ncbi:Chemotaxis signal transduction protein [Duganella sp. CF517]|uniref:chemotaxis protein CheW n=1 Tax=Duganella sp. CF517 TaxID=1881038 RepID=UPI0008B6D4CF|nr:chemotaxis protein CheW [Duganella sp. CF517]SEN19904.1 Chemotaxis signal transduction protein [Duganella sp. CF517]